jgi:thiol-disulfide isomerase/thioredoxin
LYGPASFRTAALAAARNQAFYQVRLSLRPHEGPVRAEGARFATVEHRLRPYPAARTTVLPRLVEYSSRKGVCCVVAEALDQTDDRGFDEHRMTKVAVTKIPMRKIPSLILSNAVAFSIAFALLFTPSAATRAVAAEPPPAATPPVAEVKTAGLEVLPATAAEVLDAVRKGGSRVTVVNLWATWCTPCREEFPDLMRFYKAYKDRGISLVLVSGDFSSDTEPAREFLASQGVDFRTFLKSGKDEEFINSFDPAWSGALPATFVYNDRGEKVHSFLGTVTYDSLERVVAPLAGAKPN